MPPSDGASIDQAKFDFVRFGLLFVGVAFLMGTAYFLIVGSVASDLGEDGFYIVEMMTMPPPESTSENAPRVIPPNHIPDVLVCMIPALIIALSLEIEIGRQGAR